MTERLKALAAGLERIEKDVGLAQLLMQGCPWPLVVGTADGWQSVNQAFADGLGYDRLWLQEQHWTTIAAPKDVASTKVEAASVETEKRVTEIQVSYKTARGGVRSVLWAWGPPNESGFSVAVGRFIS